MLKIQELREIIRLIDQSSIDEFTFEQDGSVVSIKKSLAASPVVQTEPVSQTPQQPVETAPVVKQSETVTPAAPSENQEQVASGGNAADENIEEIISPMVGTFYTKPSPESDTYVEVGAEVRPDSIVCIVEAMKLFNEIEAEVNGEIVEILVGDGELVEYGQPLFKVKSK